MRFYISQTIGDGKSEETAFSSRCSLYTSSRMYNCDMRTDATKPGLLLVECNPTQSEHLAMLNDTAIEYLKINKPLDVMIQSEETLSNLESWGALKIQLARYGVPLNGLSKTSTVRELAQTMVRRFTLRYELGVDDFPNASNMSVKRASRIKAKLRRKGFQSSGKVLIKDALQEYMTQNVYKMGTRHD